MNHATIPKRLSWLDICRGLALCAMIVYHFCFDLQWFGVFKTDFYRDPFWTTARTLIIASFLLVVGFSLYAAHERNSSYRTFWTRIIKISACAFIVSYASYRLFPDSYIYFGVLHFIAVASIFSRPFAVYPRFALLFGVIIVLAGVYFKHPMFDEPAFSILGFVTQLPPTEDYVPLFPWLGVVLIGIGVAPSLPTRKKPPSTPGRFSRMLSWMGRRSLWIYMLHQPILLALLWCTLKAFGRI